MDHRPVNALLHGGRRRYESSANRIFFQFAAHRNRGRGRWTRRFKPGADAFHENPSHHPDNRNQDDGGNKVEEEAKHEEGRSVSRVAPQSRSETYFFFAGGAAFFGAGAFGFRYCVSILAPIACNMPLADSANAPSGFSSRYF
jgi:hypothetical protein